MVTIDEVKRRLWNGADELRGSMDASRYKDYMLGLMFYKFLSDKTLKAYANNAHVTGSGEELARAYTAKYQKFFDLDNSRNNDLTGMLKKDLGGYCILPQYLYQKWLIDINEGNFELQEVVDSLADFEQSIVGSNDAGDFKGLFTGLDLTDTALGSTLKSRSDNIKSLILLFSDLNMIELQENDILGDAYEYLIGMFAMQSGKKAGEFYTPHNVSEVLARIVACSSKISSIYDPAVGSGSLLLTVNKHLPEENRRELNYYGQEKNTATYNLTRMNLLLHGVRPEKMEIRNGDTLAQDWPEDPKRPGSGVPFDAIVMNPPYSAKHWNKSGIKISDPRFEEYSVLPPDNKGDYAFLLHGLFHLAASGTMGILLPHGVLFRGAAEGTIRQRLIEKNRIDTIIGLPASLFTNTGIPVIIMILKKNRPIGAPVLLIDASRDFVKEGKQNALRERDIEKIVDTYMARKEEPGYSHLASRKEIQENQYNLNIPRYVESKEADISHDVDAHLFGGIPKGNIDGLKVLNTTVPDIMSSAFRTVRPGYLELETAPEELSAKILRDARITDQTAKLKNETERFVARYFSIVKGFTGNGNPEAVYDLKRQMLGEIKELLKDYPFIDVYSGFQIIADIWRVTLEKDLKKILEHGFYAAARELVPNLVTKGSGDSKHEEQDGWAGFIVSNDLVEKMFFRHLADEIDAGTERVSEIDSELDEILENAKAEDTPEASALGDSIDEDKNTIDKKKAKDALKEAEKGSEDYQILKHLQDLYAEKTAIGKKIKEDKAALKSAVEKKIPALTNEEVEAVLYEKWFGNTVEGMTGLVTDPFRFELNTIKELNERYSETLDDIEKQIAQANDIFEAMEKDLVITHE